MKAKPSHWGVQRRYKASDKTWRIVSDESIAAVMAALGADRQTPAVSDSWPLVVTAGDPVTIATGAVIELEDGTEMAADDVLPAHVPLGYHHLVEGQRRRPLIVTPPRCYLPDDLRAFGFVVQLYATRSERSWGIGDLGDLDKLGGWARGLGAGLLLCSPLHATLPLPPVEASPYYPASRMFKNPLHLDIEAIAGGVEAGIDDLAAQGRALNAVRLIDRDRVAALKMAALERIFARGIDEAGTDAFRAEQPLVDDFGLFCAVAELHGKDWRTWPTALRDPRSAGVAALRRELAPRIRFHAWIQWQLDLQVAKAGATIPLLLDLAIGVDPGGVDGWMWQEMLAPGISVGAPPDTFNTLGQDWGLPAFDPWRLRDAGYEPFIQTLRANLRHAGGLRIDHVMGLRRLWWVPRQLGSRGGAYVHYPQNDLLGIVALESARAEALIVGEDLGTVEGSLRRTLQRHGVLSYRLLIFEDSDPHRWPRQALGAVTTHDLPTVAGLWSGADVALQHRLGLEPNESAVDQLHARISCGRLAPEASVEQAIRHAHRRLARAKTMLLAATLEDVAGVAERPNHPGTTPAQNPNWSIALPMTVEDLAKAPMGTEIAQLLRRE